MTQIQNCDTYRGCLIVRHTVQYSKPQRDTVVYIFCNMEDRMHMFCVSVGSNVNSILRAKKLINTLLDEGVYYYGFFK